MVVLFLAFMLSVAPQAARVDTTAAASIHRLEPGQTVRDNDGAVLGRVEAVITGADGRARQVLVRVGGIRGVGSSVKALPVAGLSVGRDGPVAALTRTEVQGLPDVAR